MARPKNKGNRDLPDNCSVTNKGTFRYIHPLTKRQHGLGSDRAEAIQAAKILNAELLGENIQAAKILNKNVKPFGDHLDYMEEFWKKRNQEIDERGIKKLADRTYKDYIAYMRRIRPAFENKYPNELDVFAFSQYLEPLAPYTAKQHRGCLVRICRHAVARGILKENYADQTLTVETTKQRERLPYKEYKIIWNYAKPHIRNAMDIMLHLVQRPEDIIDLERPIKDNGYYYFNVIQQKTKKHGKAAYLRMVITEPLKKIVQRCQDDVHSRYLLHFPITSNRVYRGKPLSTSAISRGFAEARDIAIKKEGIFKGLRKAQLPSAYEVKSLGIFLYERTGHDAQKIAGHTNRAMTEGYLKGHPIKMTEVEVGLNIDEIEKMAANGEFDKN